MADSNNIKPEQQGWAVGKRDVLFIAIVAAVVLALVLGTTDRTTTAVPDDQVHRNTTSRAACMSCHTQGAVRPQPVNHTKVDKCFLCHTQPESWVGSVPSGIRVKSE